MTDITDLMNQYRECARNLWNAYFSAHEFTWDLHEKYESVRKMLFEGLVAYQLDLSRECCGPVDLPNLKVVPSGNSVPILINRSSEGGGYWDAEKDMSVSKDNIQLIFLDYFDWSQFPIKDFNFYRCRIVRFPKCVEYEGREALIEVLNGKVFHEEESSQ